MKVKFVEHSSGRVLRSEGDLAFGVELPAQGERVTLRGVSRVVRERRWTVTGGGRWTVELRCE